MNKYSPVSGDDHPAPRGHAELEPAPAADQPLLLQPAHLLPRQAHLRHLLRLLALRGHLAGRQGCSWDRQTVLCVQVSLVFCSVFTLIMCTTLCILPFTLVALSWLKLAPSLRATLLYPRQPGSLDRPVSTLGSYLAVPPSSCSSSPAPLPGVVSPVSCPHLHCHAPSPPPPLSPDSKRRLAELSHDLSLAQKISLASMWLLAACYGITACYPEKVPTSAVKRSIGEVVQSRRRPLLGSSPG